jgi:hypothetical protein
MAENIDDGSSRVDEGVCREGAWRVEETGGVAGCCGAGCESYDVSDCCGAEACGYCASERAVSRYEYLTGLHISQR